MHQSVCRPALFAQRHRLSTVASALLCVLIFGTGSPGSAGAQKSDDLSAEFDDAFADVDAGADGEEGGEPEESASVFAGFQPSVDFYGAVGSGLHFSVRKPELLDFKNGNWARLGVLARPAEPVVARIEAELRNLNSTEPSDLEMIGDRDIVTPVSLRLLEAYLTWRGFLIDTSAVVFDLTVGNQYVGWGEADGFNPTNYFDVYNLENPVDYDAKLPGLAAKGALRIGPDLFTVEGVMAPVFRGSLIPSALFVAGGASFLEPEGLSGRLGREVDIRLSMPSDDGILVAPVPLEYVNISYGARVKWAMLGFDWSVSYLRSRETAPVPFYVAGAASLTPAGTAGCDNDSLDCLELAIDEAHLLYPRVHVFGLALRGGLGDVGVWAEGALVLPQALSTLVIIDVPGLGHESSTAAAIEDKPYLKWVAGAEYTFRGGLFVNLQWVHGFFTEVSADRIHDYLFSSIGLDVLNERLHFELNLGGELDTTGDAVRKGGIGAFLIRYHPFDASQIVVGTMLSRGDDGATFQLFERFDQVYTELRVDF